MKYSSYRNPIVRGNAPDPSIVRVGEDYFLATSTFDFLPGITLRHSKNLVDWKILGGAVTRPSQYRRNGLPGELMLYAPTLRYAEGRFYLACTNFSPGQGNFIISAEDPAGEWSDALWLDAAAFDPSLLYDDGTWYYTRRTLDLLPDGRLGPVVQAELDMSTGQLGPFRDLSPNHAGFCSNDIEGPHLYHVGEWYYLFSAEGSTWKGHMQTCARSRSPWGPFEPAPHNPLITHRHRVGHPIQTLGHADLVQASDGGWWAVSLGTRHTAHNGFVHHHNLGRETFLLPVEWSDDGWPVIGVQGTTELVVTTDRLPGAERAEPDRVTATLWSDGWLTVGPAPAGLRKNADGSLAVPHGADLTQAGEGPIGAVFCSQLEDEARFTAQLASVPAAPAAAGVAVYADAAHHYSLVLSGLPDGSTEVRTRRLVDDLVSTDTRIVADAGPHWLTIVCTAAAYRFELDGIDVGGGSARMLSAEAAEAFVGVKFALVALGESGSSLFDLARLR